MKNRDAIFGAIIFLCCHGSLGAQWVAYEGFESYAAPMQVESGGNGSGGVGLEGGSGWSGPYDVANGIKNLVFVEDRTASPVVYENGEVRLHGGSRALRLNGNANGSYALRRALSASLLASGPVYFSFLFRTANGGPLANQDFLQLGFDANSAASAGTPRVSIGANTISTTFPPNQPFRFFARSTAATANSVFDPATDIQGVTTYLLVGKISGSGGSNFDRVDLFINPSTLAEPLLPSASVALDSEIGALTHFFVRTVGLDSTDAYVLDELRVGGDFSSVVRADGDADGLPDTWETAHGFDPLDAADAALDADADGAKNFAEYLAGTGPRDPLSRFAITDVVAEAESVALTWMSVPGRRYHLQWTDDFVTWHTVADGAVPLVVDASGTNTTYSLGRSPAADHQFYRVEVLPP